MHIPKAALLTLIVLALVGLFTVYEYTKPHVLSYLAETGWDFGDVSYDSSTGNSNKRRNYAPDWKNPEVGGDWKSSDTKKGKTTFELLDGGYDGTDTKKGKR